MIQRRSVAPDIVGFSLLLYAATLLFAVLRAPYVHKTAGPAVLDVSIYGGILLFCATVAMGLFRRHRLAFFPGMFLSLFALAAGSAPAIADLLKSIGFDSLEYVARGFASICHVPETAQLAAGVLGAIGAVLLWARRGEFQDGI